MGKLWDQFKEKCEALTGATPVVEEKKFTPARTWKNELLSNQQREDLEETVNTPGYEVLQDLGENTLEGFLTYLMQLDPADEKAVLAAHNIVHAGYLYQRSVQSQVQAYMQLNRAEREEAAELKRLLSPIPEGDNPLENYDRLAKVLDPIHVPQANPVTEKPAKQTQKTPLDVMLERPVTQ
jgi:uncharacterized protein (UPF0297 family)